MTIASCACVSCVGDPTCEEDINCGAYPGDSGTGGASGTGGSGGTSGTGGQGGQAGVGGTAGSDGGSCDTTKSPTEESCLVDDQYAVFVDGTASTSGDGSKATPFKTIAEGVAAAGSKLVLVCNTNYPEHLSITSGVKLYGGFKCSYWSADAGQRAVVAPTTSGYALEVDSVSGTVAIDGLELDAMDGAADGESSIAAFVHGSSDVRLDGVKLVAGKGKAGKAGVVVPFTFPTQAELDGHNATGIPGGTVNPCDCPSGAQTIGGAGGSAPSQSGGNGSPDLGGGQGGTAGSPTDCGNGGTGKTGANATPPSPAAGASSSGTLTSSSGWSPTSGSNGTAGGPGQGGGGGASTTAGGGGGGGCGGCGGAGGPGGGGGGASIALLVVDSTVSVGATSELISSAAGAGGKGAAGQGAQPEFGTHGNGSGPACDGGNGGKGAAGASGGGGAGGISVPVVWKGTTAPVIASGATLTPGTKGSKGVGGSAGTNDGVDGIAQATLEIT
ncbi:MAG: hypothetical protein KC776_32955 [Myxococcales bacterium]|nr:hypothetical protein [Myxococcales bacterium]